MGTKHSRELTLQQLVDKRACSLQVQLFKELFGTRVDVTVQAAIAVADKFDWGWAARALLSAAARSEYGKVYAPAWSEYNKAREASLSEYYKAYAAAWSEYDKAQPAAWSEYNKARDASLSEYYKAYAAAFATAYINDNN